MSQWKTINGWTKERMLEVIKARPLEGRAMSDRPVPGTQACTYLSPDGNKCGVGLFIPDGHAGQQLTGGYGYLFDEHPDLLLVMPLNSEGMGSLQACHDYPSEETAKARMLNWVERNVE